MNQSEMKPFNAVSVIVVQPWLKKDSTVVVSELLLMTHKKTPVLPTTFDFHWDRWTNYLLHLSFCCLSQQQIQLFYAPNGSDGIVLLN